MKINYLFILLFLHVHISLFSQEDEFNSQDLIHLCESYDLELKKTVEDVLNHNFSYSSIWNPEENVSFGDGLKNRLSLIDVAASEKERIDQIKLLIEDIKIVFRFHQIKHLYDLSQKKLKNITDDLISSVYTPEKIKRQILSSKREFYLFSYPVESLMIKGVISFVPEAKEIVKPVIFLLRGGSSIFGLPHPAGYPCFLLKDSTIIMTTYRGGVSEGVDEFGGVDILDVQALFDYSPSLCETLNILVDPKKKFMMGISRGGMQMFLTLAKFPELQQDLAGIISISGRLDTSLLRAEQRDHWQHKFNLNSEEEWEKWFQIRNPMNKISSIKKDLPIFLISGDCDLRTPEDSLRMYNKLYEMGRNVFYSEIKGGIHGLINKPEAFHEINAWMQKHER